MNECKGSPGQKKEDESDCDFPMQQCVQSGEENNTIGMVGGPGMIRCFTSPPSSYHTMEASPSRPPAQWSSMSSSFKLHCVSSFLYEESLFCPTPSRRRLRTVVRSVTVHPFGFTDRLTIRVCFSWFDDAPTCRPAQGEGAVWHPPSRGQPALVPHHTGHINQF